MSLRSRVLALTVGTAVTVLVLFAVPLALLLRQSALAEARGNATDSAQAVADYVSTGSLSRAELSAYVERTNARDDAPQVEVVRPDGTTVGARLPGLDPRDPDDDGRGTRPQGEGRDGDGDDDDRYGLRPTSQASERQVDGGQLVLIEVAGPSGVTAVAALAPSSQVRTTVLGRAGLLAGAALVVLLLAAGTGELVARRLVRHLEAAAATADRLSGGDLVARVPDAGPQEVRRVALALNRLAARIDELLLAERETVADLSHRLRTPLTAVRLDVESLPASRGKDDLENHLAQVERTLTAVIHAARRPQREGAVPQCDPAAVVRERFDFWAPLAEDQGREIVLDLGAGLLDVRCSAADLGSAIDALLENAIAHTPDETAIAVRGVRDGAQVLVDVRDRGPGIGPGAVGRGRSDRGSTGLGLDIARSLAEATGGRLEVLREDGWSVVRLALGAR